MEPVKVPGRSICGAHDTVEAQVAGGVIRPNVDQIDGSCKNWFVVSNWADVSTSGRGVTWVTLDTPLVQVGGLTANLLKLANSAYFGIPAKVGSVRQAVILLGLKRLVQMVIAACTSAIMDRGVPGYDLPAGDLWRHSLAVSVAAEGLARELKMESAEEIFTAALLHDVGKLAIDAEILA